MLFLLTEKKMIGANMAFAVFNKHPGPWRVKQIHGSEAATKFWRSLALDRIQLGTMPWEEIIVHGWIKLL